MTTDVVTVNKETPLTKAIDVLVKFNVTGLPVVNKSNELVGIVTERDLLTLTHSLATKSYTSKMTTQTVADVMTTEVKSFDVNDSLANVCQCLMEGKFRRVPIVLDKKLVGIISRKDLIALNAATVNI